MFWHRYQPQHPIGTTTSGKPIGFHYTEGGEGADRYSHFDHHDAARLHDQHRNSAAVLAGHYAKLGYMGAAKAYKNKAQHHALQAKRHMNKVLPASTQKPQTKPGNQAKELNRKAAVQERSPMTAGRSAKMKKYAPIF